MDDSQSDNNNNSGMTQREKAPAFQFYVTDYLADERVASLSLEEQGAYIRILAYAWRAKTVSSDPKVIARLVGCGCTPEIAKGAMTLLCPCHGDAMRCYSPLLEQRREEQAANRRKKARSGKLGADARWKRENLVTYTDSIAMATPWQGDGKAIANDGSSSSSLILNKIDAISQKLPIEVQTEAVQLPLAQALPMVEALPTPKPAGRARKVKNKLTNLVDMTEGELISLGKHPSLLAPRHLTRKREELLPQDGEPDEAVVWLTQGELERLYEKWGEEKTHRSIEGMSEYFRIQPDKSAKYADHCLTLQNWEKRK